MNAELRLARARVALEGLSIGDAFGQCFFQLDDTERRIREHRLPDAPWRWTDDTQMSLSIVAVLERHGCIDADALAASFARNYDYDRAYGPSMHRVLARIREGEPWRQVALDSFGGQGSWGNGSAMRAAPLGAHFADDLDEAAAQAAKSSEVTHAHAEGVAGAVAVAVAAACAARAHADGTRYAPEFFERIDERLPASEVKSRLRRARSIVDKGTLPFAVSILGNGIGMSAQDTVPFALWCCARCPDDYAGALWLAICAGGDRDTICAIVGGVVGSFVGLEGLPADWRSRREPLPDVLL